MNFKLNMGDYEDLIVFQKAYKFAMDIFQITKKFPPEKKHSLADQIRRSSRPVCANFAEAYRRRKYRAHFLSKLADCETENTETEVWIDFSKDCGYITHEEHSDLFSKNVEDRKMLFHMINNPDKYL